MCEYVMCVCVCVCEYICIKQLNSQCVAVCASVLQCIAACGSVLQSVAACCSVLQCVAVCCSVWQCVAVRCSVSQCVAACCSVLQCVVMHLIGVNNTTIAHPLSKKKIRKKRAACGAPCSIVYLTEKPTVGLPPQKKNSRWSTIF